MKKKILLLILTMAVVFGGVSNVEAKDCYQYIDHGEKIYFYSDGGSSSYGGRLLTDEEACEWGRYNPPDINAVRLTVVDKSGARVSSSVDFYSGSLPGFYSNTRVGTDKKTRNEIYISQTGYTTVGSRPHIEYFANLPQYRNDVNHAAAMMRTYFTTQFASADTAEMFRIFALLGYDGYKDAKLYENHYLMIEPIHQFSTDYPTGGNNGCHTVRASNHVAFECAVKVAEKLNTKVITILNQLRNPVMADSYANRYNIDCATTDPIDMTVCDCSLSHTYYYGTTTEIYSIMKQTNDPLLTYKAGAGGSIYTIISNLGVTMYDDQDDLPLRNASGIINNKSAIYNNMISDYGLGSMHIWMKQIMEGCPGETCKEYCPTPGYEHVEISLDYTLEELDEKCPLFCPTPGYENVQILRTDTEEDKKRKCPGTDDGFCKLQPEVNMATNCEDGPTGSVKDTEDWKCIFDTKKYDKNTYEGSFYNPDGANLSTNPFCDVVCREEINYTFSQPFTTWAGTRFSLHARSYDNSPYAGHEDFVIDPGYMSGKSVCRTAPIVGVEEENAKIDYATFLQYYKAANDAVAATWDLYQIELKKQYSIENTSKVQDNVDHGDHSCTVKYDDDAHCTAWDNNYNEVLACHTACSLKPLAEQQPCAQNCPGIVNTDCTDHAIKSADDCGDGNFEHDGHRYWSVNLYEGPTVSYDGIFHDLAPWKNSYVKNDNSDDTNHDTASATADVKSAKDAYDAAVNYRKGLLLLITECNNFTRDYTQFAPEVTFSYDDPTYGGSFPLASTSTITTSDTKYYKDGVNNANSNWLTGLDKLGLYGYINQTDNYECSGDGVPCTPGKVNYPNNDYVEQTIVKTYKFNLDTNKFRYMGKSGLQSSYSDTYTTIDYIESYKDFGEGLLPIGFNYDECTTRKEYMYSMYYGYNGEETMFGKESKFTKYHDKIKGLETGSLRPFKNIQASSNWDYSCNFNVNQEFIDCCTNPPCDGGINIIYRPISLDNPFPGEHGKLYNPYGRDPGDNWNYSFTNSLGETETATHAYITENRGVHTEEVYHETPMYEFILDSSNIRRIRKYNSQQKHNYTDFETLECYGETGEFCRSTFLENGETNGYFKFTSDNPTGGTCFGKTGTNDKEWNACRYQN